MNIGGGEAADQLVRMMLSGGEVAVRLTGSAVKNLLAISLALAKSHKKISGKVRMGNLYLLTRGFCAIGWIVDIIQIASGNFRDNMGLFLKN